MNVRRPCQVTGRTFLRVLIGVPLLMLGARATAADPTTAPTTRPSPVVVVAAVDAFWSSDQYAKSSGYVGEVKADIGDHVKKGDLLATIDVPELQSELAAAKATVIAKQEMAKASAAVIDQAESALEVARKQAAGAKAERDLAEVTRKRQEELFTGKAVTGQQMDEVRAKYAIASAAYDVAEAKISAAEADLKSAKAHEAIAKANADVAAAELKKVEALVAYTKITAPFDGVVTRRQVGPGDLTQAAMSAKTTPLFTVQKIDTVRVYCDVPESSAAKLRVGDPVAVKLTGLGGQTIDATVTRIATAVNPSTRTMRAEIDLPNPQETLRPGMYAQVTLWPAEVKAAK